MAKTIRRASVVIPCFNYGRYVDQAIASATSGTFDVEVLVVDDASTDETPEILAQVANERENVIIRRNESNVGLIETLNRGIAESTGDAIVVLSADDALAPGAVERGVAALERFPSAGFAFGRFELINGDDRVRTSDSFDGSADRILLHPGMSWLRRRCLQGVNLIASPEVMVRSSAQRTVGPYDTACRHTSDLNMWLRLAAHFDVAFIDGPTFAYHRRHGQNMSEVVFGDQADDADQRWIAFDSALDELDESTAAPLRESVRRRIVQDLLHDALRAEREIHREQLIEAARGIDPTMVASAVTRHGRLRRDYVNRARQRAAWKRWMREWHRNGA